MRIEQPHLVHRSGGRRTASGYIIGIALAGVPLLLALAALSAGTAFVLHYEYGDPDGRADIALRSYLWATLMLGTGWLIIIGRRFWRQVWPPDAEGQRPVANISSGIAIGASVVLTTPLAIVAAEGIVLLAMALR